MTSLSDARGRQALVGGSSSGSSKLRLRREETTIGEIDMNTGHETLVTGTLADLSLAVIFDGLRPSVPGLPKPTALKWGPIDIKLQDAELQAVRGRLILRVFDGAMGPPELFRYRSNESASLLLADG
jgi:hypothetical protein